MVSDIMQHRVKIGSYYCKSLRHNGKSFISLLDLYFYNFYINHGIIAFPVFLYIILFLDIDHDIPKNFISDKGQQKNNSVYSDTVPHILLYVALLIFLLLVMANDIELNPGPLISTDHNTIPHSVKGLKLCHLNVRSIHNKLDQLSIELGDFDVISISESWLDNTVDNCLLHIEGFQPPSRIDRNRHGGGVIVYVKNNIPYTVRNDLCINSLEALWIEIKHHNGSLLIGTFYIHPRLTDWNLVEISIEQASHSNNNLILLGDLNENMLIHNRSRNVHNILNTFNLVQLIQEPTRITDNTHSLIDVVIVSNHIQVSKSGVLDPICSDHCPVYATVAKFGYPCHTYKRRIWKYGECNFDFYRQVISESNWDMADLNLDEQVEKVTNNILQAASICIPNKVVTMRSKDKPWMHNEIRKEIRVRNRIHRLAKNTNSATHWANFRKKRNEVTTLIRKAKILYITKLGDKLHEGNLSPRC